jgi:predicted membrane protein
LKTFQILTLEAWPALLYDALRSPVSQVITVLYFISWVFLGNFMLLNLFLAILLDSFTEEAPHKKNEEEKTEKELQREHLDNLEKK